MSNDTTLDLAVSRCIAARPGGGVSVDPSNMAKAVREMDPKIAVKGLSRRLEKELLKMLPVELPDAQVFQASPGQMIEIRNTDQDAVAAVIRVLMSRPVVTAAVESKTDVKGSAAENAAESAVKLDEGSPFKIRRAGHLPGIEARAKAEAELEKARQEKALAAESGKAPDPDATGVAEKGDMPKQAANVVSAGSADNVVTPGGKNSPVSKLAQNIAAAQVPGAAAPERKDGPPTTLKSALGLTPEQENAAKAAQAPVQAPGPAGVPGFLDSLGASLVALPFGAARGLYHGLRNITAPLPGARTNTSAVAGAASNGINNLLDTIDDMQAKTQASVGDLAGDAQYESLCKRVASGDLPADQVSAELSKSPELAAKVHGVSASLLAGKKAWEALEQQAEFSEYSMAQVERIAKARKSNDGLKETAETKQMVDENGQSLSTLIDALNKWIQRFIARIEAILGGRAAHAPAEPASAPSPGA